MSSRFQSPPIVKAAERLLVDVENAVSRFARRHQFRTGTRLVDQATTVLTLAWKAWRDRPHQRRWVEQLRWAIDELKQHLQTAKLLHAFSSFRQFEELSRQALALGAQAGGWRQKLISPNAQNAQGPSAVVQRGEKLSTRTASAGANP